MILFQIVEKYKQYVILLSCFRKKYRKRGGLYGRLFFGLKFIINSSMTTLKVIDRQPTKMDYASPTQFKFSIVKLPKVEYFCTAANIPGITLGTATQETPLKQMPLPGDKLEYENLTLQFLVDENLENYRELHGWLTGLGFPKDWSQFRTLQAAAGHQPQTTNVGLSKELGKIRKPVVDDAGLYSDATLFVLSSKNNPILEVRFRDLVPISLSGLDYSQQPTDIDYLRATITFTYKIYEFANVGASATTETTS